MSSYASPFAITFHYNDEEFDYGLPSDVNSWDTNTYLNLTKAVGDKYGFTDAFSFYKNVNDKQFIIDNIDDIVVTMVANEISHIYIKDNQQKERELWDVNSFCLIYSRSKKEWFEGKVIKMINNGLSNDWLFVKYGKTTKKIQRNSKCIKPIPSDNILSLRKDSLCYILSDISNLWIKGLVMAISSDKDGEWLNIKYIEDNTVKITEIQRGSTQVKVYNNNDNDNQLDQSMDDYNLLLGVMQHNDDNANNANNDNINDNDAKSDINGVNDDDNNHDLDPIIPVKDDYAYVFGCAIDYDDYSDQLRNFDVPGAACNVDDDGNILLGIAFDGRELPDKCYLSEKYQQIPVYDQGKISSCVSNAVAYLWQISQYKHNSKQKWKPSRMFIYYNARKNKGKDTGCTIPQALKTMNDFGVCPGTMLGYSKDNLTQKPSQDCFDFAKEHKVIKPETVEQDLEQIKCAIMEGYPIAFAVYQTSKYPIANLKQSGIVEMPDKKEIDKIGETIKKCKEIAQAKKNGDKIDHDNQNKNLKGIGGHAAVIVGYDDNTKMFKIRDSHGSKYGDNGYVYLPYDFILNKSLCDNFWIIWEIQDNTSKKIGGG